MKTPAVGDVIHRSTGIEFLINYESEVGMHAEFADAFRAYARCQSCGSPPQPDFSLCPCSEERSLDWSSTLYRVENAIWRSILEPLWKKDRRRLYGRESGERRREAIRNSDEPAFTLSDVALLRNIQKDACYYCGASISANAQVDHLVALALGGSNGFFNIVLACPACNGSKHALSESRFWQRLRKRLPQAEFERVRETAKRIKKEKRRRWRESSAPAHRAPPSWTRFLAQPK